MPDREASAADAAACRTGRVGHLCLTGARAGPTPRQLIYKQYSWWQNCASTFFVCLVSRGLNLSNSSWISFTCSVKGESGGLRPVC